MCAEWMRLQHDSASREDALIGPPAEMPAARRRPHRVATLTATLRRPATTHPARRGGWPARRWRGLPVWATQRSPPQHSEVTEKRLSSKGGGAISNEHQRAVTRAPSTAIEPHCDRARLSVTSPTCARTATDSGTP